MSDTISIANLPPWTPTTDDILVFVDRADGITKRANQNEFPSGAGDMLKSTYDPANISQQVVGTTANQTISGKTLTTPRFADLWFIADSNGNEMLAFNSNASAVNYLELENGTTTNPPHIRSRWDDANIGMHLVAKGTGEISVCDAVDETKRMRFWISNNGTGIVTTLRSNSTGTNKTIDLPNETCELWFRNIPQNSQSSAYTLVLTDAGKHILHPSADTTARTFTIPANSSVAFPIGTAITFINQNGAWVITIAITTDTMRLAGAGTTGSRTLAANWVATAIKLTSTEWIISWPWLT